MVEPRREHDVHQEVPYQTPIADRVCRHLNPYHSNCEVADIWCAGARCVDHDCESPRCSARRPFRQRNQHAEARMRREDGADRRLDSRFDRVLLRHGYYRSELERSSVLPLEASHQLRLGMPPQKLLVECDERICSPLQGSVKPVETRDEIASVRSCPGLQEISRHLESRQLDDPKAAECIIETLNQRRQHHSRVDEASAYPERRIT